MNKKMEASQATIGQLIAVSRTLFAQKGYNQTSLEEIVDQIGMTRGALYHHYKNKKDLFRAVLLQIQEEIGQKVAEEADKTDDLWEQLLIGSVTFVKEACKPDIKQILLLDGPSVIGWQDWREMDEVNSQYHLQQQIELLQEKEILRSYDCRAMTALISGGLNELALYLAEQEAVGLDLDDLIRRQLEGFKKHG